MTKDDRFALIAMAIIMIPLILVGIGVALDAALGHC